MQFGLSLVASHADSVPSPHFELQSAESSLEQMNRAEGAAKGVGVGMSKLPGKTAAQVGPGSPPTIGIYLQVLTRRCSSIINLSASNAWVPSVTSPRLAWLIPI